MFWYFGYGSNTNLASLRAKGVVPRMSERAVLRGWRLRFNVRHFFRHEGGVANIEPTGDVSDTVWGVVHLCEDEDLALLDAAEAYGHGYDRVDVPVLTDSGERHALAYVGMPSFLDEDCRPTQRYLNILVNGAVAAAVDPAYIDALRRHPVHEKQAVPPFTPPPGDVRHLHFRHVDPQSAAHGVGRPCLRHVRCALATQLPQGALRRQGHDALSPRPAR